MQMVNDRLLSPLLVQMAVFSAIDATERTRGRFHASGSPGEIEFQNAPAPIRLDNMYAADNGSAAQVSLSAAIPLAYVLQSGFASLQLKKVALDIESFDEKKQLQIDQVSAARRDGAAGRDGGARRSCWPARTGPRPSAHGPVSRAHRPRARASLFHRGRRQRHQPHRVPADRQRDAAHARGS